MKLDIPGSPGQTPSPAPSICSCVKAETAVASKNATGETWGERLWLKNRHRLKRYVFMAILLGGYAAYELIHAATHGEIRARYGWVRIDDAPLGFWMTVAIDAFALGICVGIPGWVAWDLRRLAKKRARAMAQAASPAT